MLVLIDICEVDEVEHLFQQLWIVTILVSIFISR